MQNKRPSPILMLAPIAFVLLGYNYLYHYPQQKDYSATKSDLEKLQENSADVDTRFGRAATDKAAAQKELKELEKQLASLEDEHATLVAKRSKMVASLASSAVPAESVDKALRIFETHGLFVFASGTAEDKADSVVTPIAQLLSPSAAPNVSRGVFNVRLEGSYEDVCKALEAIVSQLPEVVLLSTELESVELDSAAGAGRSPSWFEMSIQPNQTSDIPSALDTNATEAETIGTTRTHGASTLLSHLLKACTVAGASDLHLSADEPPFMRVDGVLARTPGFDALSGTAIANLAQELAADRDWKGLEQEGALDGATSDAEGGRYRFNIFRRQGELSIAIRRLDDRIRGLEELGLPVSLYELADLRDGLVIVAGPTGSGKSTTLATLIDRINRTKQSHIITIEDPIEYLHPSQQCLVNQRQIGSDADTFYHALVASLRQDPDVILVGEVRELETIRTAITAAETGHLVFATVHAGDSVGVIERLVSVFPADEQAGIRQQLSLVLRAIISQHLMVADGRLATATTPSGKAAFAPRVVASEVLRVTSAVANLVMNGKSTQIYSTMESGSADGMQTLDQNLAQLLHKGQISERTALAYARSPNIVQERVMRMRSGGSMSGRLETTSRRRRG